MVSSSCFNIILTTRVIGYWSSCLSFLFLFPSSLCSVHRARARVVKMRRSVTSPFMSSGCNMYGHFKVYRVLYVLCFFVSCVLVLGNALNLKHNRILCRGTPTSTFSGISCDRRTGAKKRLLMYSMNVEGNTKEGNDYDNGRNNDVENSLRGDHTKNNDDNAGGGNFCAEKEKVLKEVVSNKVAKEVSTLNVCVGYRDLQPEDWFTKPENAPTNSVEVSKIDLLYDSECPICMMEVNFLQKRDIHERIRFTDLSDPSYNPAEHGNVQFADGMRKLRAVMPNGRVITGMEVFRETYEAIGLGWVFHLTRMPIIHEIADTVYDIWAENRLRITGRQDLADLLKQRQEALENAEPIDDCDLDACGIDFDDLEAELNEKSV